MKRLHLLLCLAWALGLPACAGPGTVNPDFQATQPHHRPDGFVNRHPETQPEPSFWTWQWQRWRDGGQPPPRQRIEGVPPNLALIRQPPADAALATWVGHATVLLQVGGLNLLTDPHWGERASPLSWVGPKRHQPPGLPWEDLPRIDAVLLSHNHYDHLDLRTLQGLVDRFPGLRFYVPLGVQHWMAENIRGARLTGAERNVWAADWDDTLSLNGAQGPVTLRFLSVKHWSSRSPWDRNQTLWGSWSVEHPRFTFWFSGDLGYSPDPAEIGQRLGRVDLAAIAIGAYEPRWFMQRAHINPSEAVQVMRDVRAQAALGIHWGTFEGMSDEALDQPPEDLRQALSREGPQAPDFRVLKHGQTWQLPLRQPLREP